MPVAMFPASASNMVNQYTPPTTTPSWKFTTTKLRLAQPTTGIAECPAKRRVLITVHQVSPDRETGCRP